MDTAGGGKRFTRVDITGRVHKRLKSMKNGWMNRSKGECRVKEKTIHMREK